MKNQKNDKILSEKSTGNETVTEQVSVQEKNAEKTKRSHQKGMRWTVIDTVIVLMVLLAVAGAVIRGVWNIGEDEANDGGTYYVNFTIPEIRASVLGDIAAFDTLYDYDTGKLVGYVGAYEDGSIALRTVSSLSNGNSASVVAEGTMVCLDSIMTDGSLLVRGMDTYLTPGTRLTLRTERAIVVIEISGIYAEEP